MKSKCSVDQLPSTLIAFTASTRYIGIWISICFSSIFLAQATRGAEGEAKPLTKSELEDIAESVGKVSDILKDAVRKGEEIKALKEKANAGDSEAQCSLGVKYLRGEFFIQQDFKEAKKWLERSAKQGNARAGFFLGSMYNGEYGLGRDYKRALEWFRKSATNGNSWAQLGIGGCYEHGMGVKKDMTEALRWYLLSAKNGNRAAQFNLGIVYDFGISVTKDISEATIWYRKAAEQGEPKAQGNLGSHYVFGRDGTVKTNYAEGIKFLYQAAAQGHSGAQIKLATLFVLGRGVPEDYAEAYKWALLSKAHGYEKAEETVRMIERRAVSKETLAEGRLRAKAFGIRSPAKFFGDD